MQTEQKYDAYQELRSLNDSNCLLINNYHGWIDPELLAKAPPLVIYSRFGDDYHTQDLQDVIGNFPNSRVVIITTKQYADIPHQTAKYTILKIPSAYSWYANYLQPLCDDLSDRTLTHKFLSLNNRAQWPRQALAQFLLQKDLLKDFLFSYHCQDRFGQGQRPLFDQINLVIGSTWFNQGLNMEDLWRRLPLVIGDDVHSARPGYQPGLHNSLIADIHYYTNCFASVVMETYIDHNWDPFFTEKIFKPIAYGHPFLLHSSAGALQCLRNLGFETFPEIFDESYDTLESPQMRFEHILQEIQRICSYSLHDLEDLYRRLQPKLRHNQEIFRARLPQQYTIEIQHVKSQILEIKNTLA